MKKRLFGVLMVAALLLGMAAMVPMNASASSVVNPIEYMINTSGYTLRDPVGGGIQKTVQQGDRFYYLKNPNEGARWEKYGFDNEFIWLERDTTWPAWDSTNGNTAYDCGPYGSAKLAPSYNWAVGSSITAKTWIMGFNHIASNGTVGDYNWRPLQYVWPVTRTLVYHNSSYNIGGDLGTIDVIVIETTTTGAKDGSDPWAPKGAERHWYARGYGFVRWQHWEDFTTDPNFSSPTACNPVRDSVMNRRNGSAPALDNVCASLSPYANMSYVVHQQNYGWLDWKYQGQVGGVTEQSVRSEAFIIDCRDVSIRYRAWVEGIGWQSWVGNNGVAGTQGQNRRIEGAQVELLNAPAGYHVEYRAHVENYGWMSWVRDGATCGIPGSNLRIEAFQFRVVRD